jgi:CHAT domain-containing protein
MKLSSLPGAKAELDHLQIRFQPPAGIISEGPAATETRVKNDDRSGELGRARIVVFSTHAALGGRPLGQGGKVDLSEPGLILTPPMTPSAEDDGYLSTSEVAQLHLGADLVVLSACNTAAPDGTPGAEGLSGLARAFFYAGARSVGVSHWEVSDSATNALMDKLFDGVAQGGARTRASALKTAMEEVRRTISPAPYYWAAFSLVGESEE